MTRRSLADVIARSDELADRMEAAEPQDGDQEQVSPTTRLRLAALAKAAAEREVAAAIQQALSVGQSWQQVGEILGITENAAFQRYGPRLRG